MNNNRYKIYIHFDDERLAVSCSGKSTIYDIKKFISKRFEIPVSSIGFRIFSTDKQFELPDSTLLCNTGIESGEILIVEDETEMMKDSDRQSQDSGLKFQQTPDPDGLIMIRRIVPADNSCLFNAIGYAMENKSRDSARYLRQIVACYIASDPDKYNEVVLEMCNNQYQEWIMNELNWGGAIEIEILSQHYEVEICIVDVKTLKITEFGIDKDYKHRIYLLYDGAHYETIVKNISEDMDEETDITLFSPRDKFASEGALMLAKELNSRIHSDKSESFDRESQDETSSKESSEENLNQMCHQQANNFKPDTSLNNITPFH